MASKKIRVANLQSLGLDPLLSDQGSVQFTDEGLQFIATENPEHQISVVKTIPTGDGSFDQDIRIVSISTSSSENIQSQIMEQNTEYEYFFSNMNTDLTYEEATAVNTDPVSDLLDVEFEYNYRDSRYEQLLQNITNHNFIPSMYDMLDDEYITGVDPDGEAFRKINLKALHTETLYLISVVLAKTALT